MTAQNPRISLSPFEKKNSGRDAVIDSLRAVACFAIVAHHLVFFGPLADAVHGVFPAIVGFLYDYGRMAVQVFLVLSGYLLARTLYVKDIFHNQAWKGFLLRRYERLAIPYLMALILAIFSAAMVRMMAEDPGVLSTPGEPEMLQVVSHVLLLQTLLGQESLSAGVWYVAIDFQLVMLVTLLAWISQRLRIPVAIMLLVMTASSLFYFNLDSSWDATPLYFMGSYGAGMLLFHALVQHSSRSRFVLLALLVMLLGTALMVEFRGRLLFATAVVFFLAGVHILRAKADGQREHRLTQWLLECTPFRYLPRFGEMSYSIFLIHYPVALLVMAVVHGYWPGQVVPSVLGLVLAFVLSLFAGGWFYQWVEKPSLTLFRRMMIPLGLLVTALIGQIEFVM